MILGNEKIHGFSIHRAPEWRWLTAQKYVKKRAHSPSFANDIEVDKARTFLEQVEACKSDWDYENLFRKKPDQYMALSFWIDPVRHGGPVAERPRVEELRRQAAIEAYLLTDLRHDQIAGKMCITPEAVLCYENWFYDFRMMKDCGPWMSTVGIRNDLAGTSGCSFDGLLRLYGWRYGAKHVDEMLMGTNLSEVVREAFKNDGYSHLLKNTALISRATTHQSVVLENTNRMIESSDRRKENEIKAGTDYRSDDTKEYIVSVETKMASHSWCMADPPKDIEASIPKVEKRVAVRLGYDKDLSNQQPSG